MTVRSIVDMFENMAGSRSLDKPAHPLESPRCGNVHGLVTYYDALGVVEEGLPTKTVRIQPALGGQGSRLQQHKTPGQLDPQQLEEEELENEGCQEEGKEQVRDQNRNQAMSNVPAASALPKSTQNYSLPMSGIPAPKSRENHVAASMIGKPSFESAPSIQTSSTVFVADVTQPLFVPPPTPVSARIRGPRTSYAAFATRIENSSSRLLDFEKDERWLGQVETMKCRVEMLKLRNQIALAREVASAPRKSRSTSECSGVSTTSTASMSSTDLPDLSCQ